jgi:multiple sugar transport system ATP-binding protein
MSAIALRDLTKVFPDGTVAVEELSLDVNQGEFMVLLGPTGCGKSTILRLIAGLDRPTSGHVYLDGKLADPLTPRQRDVAMVFQDYALYPHLTVADNIAFPLRTSQLDEREVTARVNEIADLLGIESELRRLPDHLSGGQRQRVAMARAVVRRPGAFLLDEPMSNLDAHLREDLRAEVVNITRAFGVTTVYVTHDRIEALTMADRIAVLRKGKVQQVGAASEVYGDPANIFVAAFLGPGHTSLLQAAVYAEDGGAVAIDLGSQVLRLPAGDPRAAALAGHHTARVTVGVRAEGLRLVDAVAGERDNVLTGVVRLVEDLGHEAVVHVDTGAAPAALATTRLDLPNAGGTGVRSTLSRFAAHDRRLTPTARTEYGFYPRYEPSEEIREPRGDLVVRVPRPLIPGRGAQVALAVDVDRLYLFDRAGERIRLS